MSAFAKKHVRKQAYQAYSPSNAPCGVHIGIEYDSESEDYGKYVLLNSSMSRVRGVAGVDSPDGFDRVFEIMIDLMTRQDMQIWQAATRARDRALWESEAEQAGISVEDYIAQKHAAQAEADAQRAKAKALKEKAKAITDKVDGIDVGFRKGKAEIRLPADKIALFTEWIQNADDGAPQEVADFIAALELESLES